jgi:hypothetical protein
MPSDSGQIVIGVDLDLCADFYARMREVAAEWFEVDISTLTPDVSYGLPEWGVRSAAQYESLHRFAVTQRDLFSTVEMIPGARRVLRKLSDEGYRIRIITHRLFIQYFHGLAVRQGLGISLSALQIARIRQSVSRAQTPGIRCMTWYDSGPPSVHSGCFS